MRRRYVQIAGICVSFLAGVVLLVLAADVTRWQDAFAADDVRYRDTPEGELWEPDRIEPVGMVRTMLGVEDDVAFRAALRAFRLSHPEGPSISDPNLVVMRNEATAKLTDLVEHAKDAHRQAVAANLLGVLSYSDAIYDYTNRGRLIASAISRYQQSIGFEPENDDAKYNLELALALSRGLGLTESGGGTNPSPGGKGSKGAGAGEPGSGY
jgi:hypothetical protein